MTGSRARSGARSGGRPATRARTRQPLILAGALVTGLGSAAVIGGWPGAVTGVVVAATVWVAARRWRESDRRQLRIAATRDLPIMVDLLAAALRSGTPPARAAEVVGAAVGGPVGRRLVRVGTALRVGARPEQAWGALAPVPGADRVVRAAVRSADSGAALTGALYRLADDLRAARATRVEAGAHRLGVLVVLPLGLCFLPAFLLTGVVPVVVAVLGDVLRTR
jgi:pilus assembly protein TadC